MEGFRRRFLRATMVAAVAAASMLAGCEGHVEPVDYSTRVGNIYLRDGRTVPAAALEEGMTPVGVVSHVAGEGEAFKAVVVALDDIGMYNASDTVMDYRNVSTDTAARNGKANTAAMLVEYLESDTDTVRNVKAVVPPAALAAYAYAPDGITGWFVPSSGELLDVADNIAAVNAGLVAAGGRRMSGTAWYLSSTQDGTSDGTAVLYFYTVSMEGTLKVGTKRREYLVRPFILIE